MIFKIQVQALNQSERPTELEATFNIFEGRWKRAGSGDSRVWGSLGEPLNTQYIQDGLAAFLCRTRILGTRDIKKYRIF